MQPEAAEDLCSICMVDPRTLKLPVLMALSVVWVRHLTY
jgi:hypothetical protein